MTEVTTWTYTAEHSGSVYPEYEITGTLRQAMRAAMQRFEGDLNEVEITVYWGSIQEVARYGKGDCLVRSRRLGDSKWTDCTR